jgi:hypothetical protein
MKPSGGSAPTFEKPQIRQENNGKNIVTEVRCTANPKPTFTWFKGAATVKTSASVKTSMTQEGDLYIFILEIVVSIHETELKLCKP